MPEFFPMSELGDDGWALAKAFGMYAIPLVLLASVPLQRWRRRRRWRRLAIQMGPLEADRIVERGE